MTPGPYLSEAVPSFGHGQMFVHLTQGRQTSIKSVCLLRLGLLHCVFRDSFVIRCDFEGVCLPIHKPAFRHDTQHTTTSCRKNALQWRNDFVQVHAMTRSIKWFFFTFTHSVAILSGKKKEKKRKPSAVCERLPPSFSYTSSVSPCKPCLPIRLSRQSPCNDMTPSQCKWWD